jgi:hypothetical protein
MNIAIVQEFPKMGDIEPVRYQPPLIISFVEHFLLGLIQVPLSCIKGLLTGVSFCTYVGVCCLVTGVSGCCLGDRCQDLEVLLLGDRCLVI